MMDPSNNFDKTETEKETEHEDKLPLQTISEKPEVKADNNVAEIPLNIDEPAFPADIFDPKPQSNGQLQSGPDVSHTDSHSVPHVGGATLPIGTPSTLLKSEVSHPYAPVPSPEAHSMQSVPAGTSLSTQPIGSERTAGEHPGNLVASTIAHYAAHPMTNKMTAIFGYGYVISGGLYSITVVGAIIGVPMFFSGLRLINANENLKKFHLTKDPVHVFTAIEDFNKHFSIMGWVLLVMLVLTVIYAIGTIMFISSTVFYQGFQ
jgi:Family of unknown function (DUF5362)